MAIIVHRAATNRRVRHIVLKLTKSYICMKTETLNKITNTIAAGAVAIGIVFLIAVNCGWTPQ